MVRIGIDWFFFLALPSFLRTSPSYLFLLGTAPGALISTPFPQQQQQQQVNNNNPSSTAIVTGAAAAPTTPGATAGTPQQNNNPLQQPPSNALGSGGHPQNSQVMPLGNSSSNNSSSNSNTISSSGTSASSSTPISNTSNSQHTTGNHPGAVWSRTGATLIYPGNMDPNSIINSTPGQVPTGAAAAAAASSTQGQGVGAMQQQATSRPMVTGNEGASADWAMGPAVGASNRNQLTGQDATGPISKSPMPEFWCSIAYFELDNQVCFGLKMSWPILPFPVVFKPIN